MPGGWRAAVPDAMAKGIAEAMTALHEKTGAFGDIKLEGGSRLYALPGVEGAGLVVGSVVEVGKRVGRWG